MKIMTAMNIALVCIPSRKLISSLIFLEQSMLKIYIQTNILNTIERCLDGVTSTYGEYNGVKSKFSSIPLKI